MSPDINVARWQMEAAFGDGKLGEEFPRPEAQWRINAGYRTQAPVQSVAIAQGFVEPARWGGFWSPFR